MSRIPVDGPLQFRLPAEAVRRLERELVLRVLAGWGLLAILVILYG
jgi:hypothetical protein